MLKLSNLESIGKPVYKFQNNHSVDFDGVDDFIQLSEPISYTQHTISTWIKVSDSDATKTILDARDSADDGIRIFLTNHEVVTYSVNTSDITSGSAISVDEWHHIVGTYDGTTQKLYIDGSLVSSATTSQTISTTTNAEIGSRNFSDRANEFLGKIDELAIYDRALTAAEVTEIYRIKYGANLVLNGNLDELGSELVTNGDFSDGTTDWTVSSGTISVDNGRLKIDSVSGTTAEQTVTAIVGKTYKVTYDLTLGTATSGATIITGGNYPTLDAPEGTNTFYSVATSTSFRVRPRLGSDGTMFVDNISVKQVDPNDRWTLNTGWSYGDSKAICDGSQTSTSNFVQSDTFDNDLTDTYKLSFDLVVTQGSVTASSGSMSQSFTTSGFKSFIGSPTTGAGNLNFTAGTTFIGSVTNVMVEKQKYVATNLKLNSGNYKSADPVIVSTKSVDFDGSDAYLEVQDATALQLAGSQATWSFWTKLDTLSGGDMKFLAKAISAGSDLAGYQIRTNNADLLYQFNNGTWRTVTASNFFLDLNFTHVAITHDGSNNVKIYRNGVLVEDSSIGYVIPANTGELLFGARTPDSPTNFLNGKLDEVGIFNTALTSDQVGELYNQGVPSNLSTHSANANLAAYYKMGDGTLDEAPLIADQTNATLGSELVTNGDYSNGLTGWSADSEWSEENGLAVFDGSGVGSLQQSGVTTVGKTFKLTFDVTEITNRSGLRVINVTFNDTYALGNEINVGTNTFYFTPVNGTGIRFRASSGTTCKIDNVSIKQVNGNPALMINTPTIVTDAPLTKIRNYYRMGDGILDTHPLICDMVEPSLGSELVTNGDFATSGTVTNTSFTLGFETSDSGITISDGVLNLVNADNSSFDGRVQFTNGSSGALAITSGGAHVLEYEVVANDASSSLFLYTGTGYVTLTKTVGVHKYIYTTNGSAVYLRNGSNNTTIKIDNVSLKEVQGVTGAMTNMSEADITNDVPS